MRPQAREGRGVFKPRRVKRRRAVTRTAAKRGSPAGQKEQAPAVESEGSRPEPAQDSAGQIKDLAELREQGILTEEEFAAEKKKLLGP